MPTVSERLYNTLCGQVFDRFGDHAAVCGCAGGRGGPRSLRTGPPPTERERRPLPTPPRQRQAPTTRKPRRTHRRVDAHGEDSTLEVWDCEVSGWGSARTLVSCFFHEPSSTSHRAPNDIKFVLRVMLGLDVEAPKTCPIPCSMCEQMETAQSLRVVTRPVRA